MLKFNAKSKGSRTFGHSDFPAENPRTQDRTILIRNRCSQCPKTLYEKNKNILIQQSNTCFRRH